MTLDDEILTALRRIIRATDQHSRALLTKHGLTGPQWAALRILVEEGEQEMLERCVFMIALVREFERAVDVIDLAKLRTPFNYLAYAAAGYLHMRHGDASAALAEFIQARRLNPLDFRLAVDTSRAALESDDFESALESAVDAMKRGADDYLTKPIDRGDFVAAIARHLNIQTAEPSS